MSWIELVAQRRPPQIPEGLTAPENATDWYRIENNAETPDATDVYVYDSIGGWFGTTADDFVTDLRNITTKNINVRLNSPGGSVYEGITIANAIRSHSSRVTVYVDGLAASIASIIALAGDRLVMMPNSQFMIHDASGGCFGNAADMEYMVGLLNKQSDNLADAYADRAGGTAAEWRELMKAETWYTAKEAVAAGLADEVMPTPAREPEEQALAARMQSVWDLTAYRYAGREKAPVPKLVASAEPKVEITIGGQPVELTDQLAASLRRMIPRTGGVLTNSAVAVVGERGPELVVPATETESEDTHSTAAPDAALLDSIRELIRAEFEELKSALPPWLKKDGDEDEDEEEEPEDALTEEVEDATDPEEVEDEETVEPSASLDEETSPESPVDAAPDVEDTSVVDAAAGDEWSSLVARLTVSPSPSADDVFNRLKEAL